MVEYSKINCKLTNVQLNKFKKAVKSNEGATLRLGIKTFNKDELPHELLLTTRQDTKLRDAINNNLATDIKLRKSQIKKLIESGGFLGKLLSKLAGPLMKVAIENETKEQRGGFLSRLLGTWGASLLGNLLSGKGMMSAGEGIVRAGEGSGSKKKTKFAITISSIN